MRSRAWALVASVVWTTSTPATFTPGWRGAKASVSQAASMSAAVAGRGPSCTVAEPTPVANLRPMPGLPSYADLPVKAGAPPGSSWGLWGDDDVLGTLNLLTPERTAAAARL